MITRNADNSFFDFASRLFYDCSKRKPDEIDFLISRKYHYPLLLEKPKISAIFPIPYKHEDSYVFADYVFEDSEGGNRNLWSLFLASICHLAGHCSVSRYEIYDEWQKNKTQEICWRVIDFIEDIKVEEYLYSENPNLAKNIQEIKTICSNYEQESKTKSTQGLDYFTKYNHYNKNIKIHQLREKILQRTKISEQNVLEYADVLYKNRDLLPSFTLPFCEHHKESTMQHLKTCRLNICPTGNFAEDVTKLEELWKVGEHKKARMLSRYRKSLKGLKFHEIVIPTGNMYNYMKMKSKNNLFLKNIRNQLRLIVNTVDDPITQQIGTIDMQLAIQAIAAESNITDVFNRDEERRGEEAWIILIDNSASMQLKFDIVKEFALCIAESADILTGSSDAWALYSFDSKFSILKDFKENYNQEIKARLGGLSSGGLSFIPDALTLAGRLLQENPRDRKFIIMITDGYSSGYENIGDALIQEIKYLEMSGISIIGIGLPDSVAKYCKNYAVGPNMRKLVGKFISAYRNAAERDL
ncbi:MAG: VWA domain-containing protein [Thaumarchaeota archaeon]|nr:VWA domain-containing protein [Nitrososphaerota archaeon]